MSILRYLSHTTRRWFTIAAGVLLVTAAVIIPTAGQANATAQTCISYQGGSVCTAVSGTSDYVGYIDAAWFRVTPPWGVCNYSVWFFYIPPSGGAYGLKYFPAPDVGTSMYGLTTT